MTQILSPLEIALEECIREAREALLATGELRKLYEEIKG